MRQNNPAGPDLDRSIAEAIDRGEHRRALIALCEHYGAAIGRLCTAMLNNRGEAEELTQEILLAAHSAMPTFQGRSSVRRWLYGIARRSCSRALRRRRRRGELHETAISHERALRAETAEPESTLIAAREAARLREALATLSDGRRDVLLLRYVSGLSYREIAAICEIREDAARQRAAAGLRVLRQQLAGPRDERAHASSPPLAEIVPLLATSEPQELKESTP
jgi:RNA polymerase sigma-70 factor (ECF subfamily)